MTANEKLTFDDIYERLIGSGITHAPDIANMVVFQNA